MSISPYMNINRIEFIVTYQCSGHCKHCSVGGKLNHSGGVTHVSANRAAEAIKELTQIYPISSVMTFGGEPLLYTDVVCAIHESAKYCSIESRQLITNGYFTKRDEQCKQAVTSLKEAGVNYLLLSADAFHQETIPVKAVYSFAKYAKEAEIHKIRLQPAWVVSEDHENRYNIETKEILALFADLQIPINEGNNIFMAGNAAKYLAQYYDEPHLDLSDSCGSMPYTEPLTDITSLSIVPNGDVMICGFIIGNIHAQSMKEIVSQYNPYQNERMNSILTEKAAGLLEFAKKKKIKIDSSRCYSVCDLCCRINDSVTNSAAEKV